MQRCVVRQHHPARTDAEGSGDSGKLSDQDFGNGGGDTGHVVVFGDPETVEAETFGVPG